jgi:hypothetical protein
MPRPIAQPKRSEVLPHELELHDAALQRWLTGYKPDAKPEDEPTAPLALAAELHSPRYAVAIGAMGTASRTAGDQPGGMAHIDREWVDQVLSYDLGYYNMLETHTPDAIATGVRVEAIEALRDGRENDLTEREQLLTAFIREVATRSVTDETWDAVEQEMGTRAAVEVTIFACYFQFLVHLFMAFGGPITPREAIDDLITDIKEGRRELPDWRAHIR